MCILLYTFNNNDIHYKRPLLRMIPNCPVMIICDG